jgi:adenylate cyclase
MLVSEVTRARCGEDFAFTAAAPLPVSGKPEPVATFIPGRRAPLAAPAGETPVLSGAAPQPVR